MRRNAKMGGRIEMALLALAQVVLLIAAIWIVVTHGQIMKVKIWLPPLASVQGRDIDRLFYIILWVTGIVFLLVQGVLTYFIVRYRGQEGERALYWHHQPVLEIAWTVIPALILITITAMAGRTWAQIYFRDPPKDAVVVEVTGRQFDWLVRYPGRDGKFGRINVKLITEDNPLGLDAKDKASQDDIWLQNEMHLPVNRPVVVRVRSQDVIHSFFVPKFRVKQDAVPGMTIPIWFVPTQTSNPDKPDEFACAELCGQGHYNMRGILMVEEQKQFESWLKEQLTFGE